MTENWNLNFLKFKLHSNLAIWKDDHQMVIALIDLP